MQKQLFQKILIVIFLSGIAFQVLWGLSKPRFWNDEGETAVYGQRILKYGYPKIDDGKNILFLLCPWIEKGSIKNTAYIGSVWAQYYFGAIGTWIADYFDNDYSKTFAVRFPFALVGFLSLFCYLKIIFLFFKNRNLNIALIYLLFIFFHTHLLLHIREARYYSLILFGQSLLLFIWYKSQLMPEKTDFKKFCILFILINFLNFNSFYPAAIITFIYIFLCFIIKNFKSKFKNISFNKIYHFIITGGIFLLLINFYKIVQIQKTLAQIFTHSLSFFKFINIAGQLLDIEYLYLFISGFIISLVLFFIRKQKNTSLICSYNLTGYIFFYILIASFSKVFFIRYLVVLHPLISICIIIQWHFIIVSILNIKTNRRVISALLVIIIPIVILMHYNFIFNTKQHIKSLFQSYKGPLDIAVEFIRMKFKNPKDIILATNIEEPCFMFYLDCKVIIGLTKPNLEDDLKLIPHVILFRKKHDYDFGDELSPSHSLIFNDLIKKAQYSHFIFPVVDDQFNNFPSLSGYNKHSFSTNWTDDVREKIIISIKT